MQKQSWQLKDWLLGDRTASGWTGPRFYLHEEGAFNFTDRAHCFFEALGTTYERAMANMDDLVLPNIAEHTTDVWLLDRLRGHPGRVYDALEADLHIIGSAFGVSYHATLLPGAPCGTAQDHYRRVKAAFRKLKNRQLFKRDVAGRKRWMIVDTDWDWSTHVLIPEFAELIKSGEMLLATVDRDVSALGLIAPENTIVLPYKVHAKLETDPHLLVPPPLVKTADRFVSFAFHGNMARQGQGAERFILWNITSGLESVSVQDVSFYGKEPADFAKVTSRTVAMMEESIFCMVPAGDTASSRRLFDALAAGCVPIIFHDFEAIAGNLPFTHSIDWTKIAYFAGSLQCLADHVQEAKEWLRTLQRRQGDREVTEKQALGHKTFHDMLSYRGGDLSSAMLAEAGMVRSVFTT